MSEQENYTKQAPRGTAHVVYVNSISQTDLNSFLQNLHLGPVLVYVEHQYSHSALAGVMRM